MKCLKCGAETASNLSSTWCDSCAKTSQKNRLMGFVAFFGVFALIVFGLTHACSRLFDNDPSSAISINDYANATDDIWCMDSKESLDKLVELAAKNAYDEMNELFLSSGVTTLAKGQSVEVIDEGFSGYRVRTLGGQECWVTSNMLSKESDPSAGVPNQSTSPTPAPGQTGATEEEYKAAPGEEIIGRWQDAAEAGGWAYVIVRSKGKLYMDVLIPPDNSPTRDDLTVTDSTSGRKYLSDTGDYFLIAGNGSLREYDREGYIRTARRVQK